MIKLTDSRGNKSLTLGFVVIAFMTGTGAFIYSTITGGTIDLASYGIFMFTNLLPWLAREYKEKDKGAE